MTQKIALPRGTVDLLPEEIPQWLDVEQKARHLLNIYGYKEIRTPFFEETELFARSMGQTSEVVQKQMLNLRSSKAGDAADVEGGGLSLRPEGTASIARSYIQNSLDKKENLSKLYYLGPMFRGERPQKGRLRQFHQIGAEAIGPNSASAYLDAEMMALSVNLLQTFGLKNFKLKINTLGTPEDKIHFADYLRKELKPYLRELSQDSQDRFQRNVFRILDSKDKADREIVDRIPIGLDYLSEDSRQYYSGVKEALNHLGIGFEESPGLVRGLDYYTHTVFEISSSALGSQDALCAGGRYNNLVSELGGPQVDAVGFALGIERVLLALGSKNPPAAEPLDFYLIALDEISFKEAFRTLNILRKHRYSSDMNYRAGSVKSQMRQANKSGARFVMIFGSEEIQKGVITLKNMETGRQQELDRNNYLSLLGELLRK